MAGPDRRHAGRTLAYTDSAVLSDTMHTTVDVTSAAVSGQQVGFVLDTASPASATYETKESTTRPVLLLDGFQ